MPCPATLWARCASSSCDYDRRMASRRARIGFWVGIAIAVFVLALIAAITFTGHGSEYGGGGGGDLAGGPLTRGGGHLIPGGEGSPPSGRARRRWAAGPHAFWWRRAPRAGAG